MASLYKRPNSPFWWIKWREPSTLKSIRESTKFRIGIGQDYRRARELCANLTAKETKIVSRTKGENFDAWAESYVKARYANNSNTRQRNLDGLQSLLTYFDTLRVHHPRQVIRQHCIDFMGWRCTGLPAKGLREVSHNTALLELKLFSVLMREALKRCYIQANPCTDLGFKQQSARPKPEISDAEIALIRAEINNPAHFVQDSSKYAWPHILRVSFEIALHQGCRISETHMDVHRDVDLENRTIFFRAKGDKYYEAELNPALVPLFESLRKEGRKLTYERPKQRTMVSLYWHKFLKRIGLPHLSFHSTRVTFISRLERAGAPEHIVMKLVNHASTSVHRIYRRTRREELQKYWGAFPSSSSSDKSPSSQNPDALPANPPPPSTSTSSHAKE